MKKVFIFIQLCFIGNLIVQNTRFPQEKNYIHVVLGQETKTVIRSVLYH